MKCVKNVLYFVSICLLAMIYQISTAGCVAIIDSCNSPTDLVNQLKEQIPEVTQFVETHEEVLAIILALQGGSNG